jgi:molybdenum cofactor cytidylyltransferase
VAEIQAVFASTTGGFLVQKSGPIHGQSLLDTCGASNAGSKILFAILAAGLGSRLGMTKPLVKWKHTTLLQNIIEVCAATESGDIAVVTGYRHNEVREAVPDGVLILHNEEYAEGIASSIRAAVNAASQGGYKFLMLLCCDQPFIQTDDLIGLIAARQIDRPITAAEYADTFGIPAIFAADVFDDLLALRGDKGAKKLMAPNKERTTLVRLESAAFDLDTPEQLEGLLAGSI